MDNDYKNILTKAGILYGDGLDERAIGAIEAAFRVRLPVELRIFLTECTPIGPGFPDWTAPSEMARGTLEYICEAFEFDIEHNGYWHPLLGERPSSTLRAIVQARSVVNSHPLPVPIYGHRFVMTNEVSGAAPVISIVQPGDTVVYSENIKDYLKQEFLNKLPDRSPITTNAPFWYEVLGITM